MTSTELAWKIRRHGVEMTHLAQSSHIGSVLSVADILAVLYADVLRVRAEDPDWADRDRFVLSKGHAGAALYAALAERGFFPMEWLKTYHQEGSILSGHASHFLPGVECTTGSLGHGFSIGVGMALAAKQDGKDSRVYVILGDGECNEGAVWEAAQAASFFGLDNVVAIVDHNKLQSLDHSHKTILTGTLEEKWRAFGWHTLEVDGHDHDALRSALVSTVSGKPTAVIAHTVKGKGICFMEGNILWHYRYPHPGWEYDWAVEELHRRKPEGVEDPYTPDGIKNPERPGANESAFRDQTLSATYHPAWFSIPGVQP